MKQSKINSFLPVFGEAGKEPHHGLLHLQMKCVWVNKMAI